MRFIFLDVDGVLNSEKFLKEYVEEISSENLERLVKIVEATDAKIVLTSSWKIYLNLDLTPHNDFGEYLIMKLDSADLSIYAMTDDDGSNRGEGISNFLIDNPCEAFVILDDENFEDFKEYDLESHLVQTSFEDGGLQDEHVEKAIQKLLET